MKAFGLARLGRDVELRYLPNGDAVANLSLAFSFGRKGEDGKRPTQWVDASLWGKRAEALVPYLLKGGLIEVTLDEVCIQSFDGQNGPGHKLVGKVLDIELAGSRENAQPAGNSSTPAPRPAAAPARQPAPQPSRVSRPASGFDDMDDDIPF